MFQCHSKLLTCSLPAKTCSVKTDPAMSVNFLTYSQKMMRKKKKRDTSRQPPSHKAAKASDMAQFLVVLSGSFFCGIRDQTWERPPFLR